MALNGGGAAAGWTAAQAYLEGRAVRDTRSLIAELCRHFYTLGWVSGTGGSVALRVHEDSLPRPNQLIALSPSGVQKERMEPEDMYVLSASGNVLSAPSAKPYPNKPPKCTDSAAVFLKIFEMRNAGAVVHSHGIESCLVTMLNPSAREFRTKGLLKYLDHVGRVMFLIGETFQLLNEKHYIQITHLEMIKGIQGHGYYDELVVPIIENTAHEYQLTESLAEAIEAYPRTTAVLVRNHGVYIWGDTWISAKTQAECYHYLFDAAVKLCQLGLDWSTPNHGSLHDGKALGGGGDIQKSLKAMESVPGCILLDIEGTTTPISFVSDVLFPYARDNVESHLSATFHTTETQDDIRLLRGQIEDDLERGVHGAVPVPADEEGKEKVIAALVANAEAMIRDDRKITSLKQLQGHIWKTGFAKKELKGVVFDDVPLALEKWNASGKKIYIYSSGSRLAQRLLFGSTNHGDLRKHLSGFFDTAVGNKRETISYVEIFESLGVDEPSEILFLTDVYQEAVAAKQAGLQVIISVRPGNASLPEDHGFKTISSFAEV